MPFGVKNGPPTFQRAINRTFKKYLDQFMKIFLDDFTVYYDMEGHLMKLRLCFQKCKEYKKFSNLMIVFQKMHLVCVSMVLARFYIVNMHFYSII
jgi:hypothetical protein